MKISRKMVYKSWKVSMIVLMTTLVYLTIKYWRAKESKDLCYISLDKHIRLYKDTEKDARSNKESFSKLVRNREAEISELTKDKTELESRLKVCSVASAEKDRQISLKVVMVEDKERIVEEKNKQLDDLLMKNSQMRSEFQKISARETVWLDEREQLELDLANSRKAALFSENKIDNALEEKRGLEVEILEMKQKVETLQKLNEAAILKNIENKAIQQRDIEARKNIDEKIENDYNARAAPAKKEDIIKEPYDDFGEVINKPLDGQKEVVNDPLIDMKEVNKPFDDKKEVIKAPFDDMKEVIEKPMDEVKEVINKPVDDMKAVINRPVDEVEKNVYKPIDDMKEDIIEPVAVMKDDRINPLDDTKNESIDRHLGGMVDDINKPVDNFKEVLNKPLDPDEVKNEVVDEIVKNDDVIVNKRDENR